MAVQSGRDYALSSRFTWVGKAGVGTYCVVATKRYLLAVPVEVEEVVWNRSITTTTFQLGQRPVDVFLAEVVAKPDVTVEQLEALMRDVAAGIQGAVMTDLIQQQRLKVRSGFFSRGIYVNAKASGLGGWSGYALPREGLRAFEQLFVDSPIRA